MSAYCPHCSQTLADGATGCAACGSPPPEAGFPGDARLGQVVAGGQYRVLRRIGAGGYGVVYEVETLVGRLRRALKVLSKAWAEDPEVRQRFVNEALVLEQVSHPNIARCFAAGRLDDGDLYLLFELIDGVPLGRLLRPRRGGPTAPIEPMRAVRLAKQIAAGLRAAHDSGVLHRDLKPDNILVIHAGTHREQAKVVDFGIAKLTSRGLASTQSVVGTPEYMPPEQAVPGAILDARVDLWQLGATLFAMLTGTPPYPAELLGAGGILAAQQARLQLGPAPSEVVAALRAESAVDLLVSRLLATDPDRRPSSAAEVCEELARIEHGLAPDSGRSGSEALLGALCSTPSDSGWLALHGYLASQVDDRDALVAAADRMLATWPDELRRAPSALWEASRRQPHPLWPMVRALDLSARGLGDDDLARLADNPALATITRLDLSRNEVGNRGLAALAASPHLQRLVHLDLGHNRVTSQGVEALAGARGAGGLRSLSLAHNGVGARGIHALAGSALRLVELELSGNDLGPDGAAALADSAALAGLRRLGLADARIGPDGAAALAVSPHLTRLRILDLSHNAIGAGGAASLALSRNLEPLRALHLARNGLGRQGVQLLLGSACFGDLGELDLSGNGLGSSGAMLLAGSSFVRRLERLMLADDDLGDAGLAAILGSGHLGGLRALGVAANRLSAAGAALLVDASLQLDELDLSANPIGDEGAAALADALGRLRIRRLRVTGCGLRGDGLARMLDAGRLLALDAARNPLGAAGAEGLAAARGATSLEELELAHCDLGPDGLGALAGSPHLGLLRSLGLSSNRLGDAGVTALVAGAPRLPRLEHLTLDDNDLGPDAAVAIAASPLSHHLCNLSLGHNRLGDAGAEALARGPSWHALRALNLDGNALSLGGAAAVTSSERMGILQRLSLAGNALSAVVDVYSLGHDKIARMEASFGRLVELGADFAARFYDELFARYPSVKPLFARTTMPRQHRHLMSSLVLVLDNLRNPELLEVTLRDLGQQHVGFQVAPSHYYAVVSTLLDTLRDVFGEDWTPELRDAWSDGLEAVATAMMAASKGAAAVAGADRR